MQRTGMLEVICGPMFSGKSEELIRRVRRAHIARQSVMVFKHQLDSSRYAEHEVVSHNGTRINAVAVANVYELLKIVSDRDINVIGIDEVQFFPQDIIEAIVTLIDNSKRVIVAGLDLDFRGVPFGTIPTLLAIADDITKLRSICTPCGHDAHFTQRLVNGNPAHFEDPIILVGAQESYQARCRQCYHIDKTPRHIPVEL